MIELFWVFAALLSFAVAWFNNSRVDHFLDPLLTSPLLPWIALVGSILLFRQLPGGSTNGWLLLRFAVCGLVGPAVMMLVILQFSPHLGPGGLGLVALDLIYWSIGAAALLAYAGYLVMQMYRSNGRS